MKKSLTIIIFLICLYRIDAQLYNEYVNDKQINQFMIHLLVTKTTYKNAFNKDFKKIYYKPIHIGKANWSMYDKLNENLSFEVRFKKLFKRSDLNKNDFDFMKNQYQTIKDTEWNFEHRKLKLKKIYRKNYFKYSIPIFNKDMTLAIMWRYKYCGSLCAYSELHIYEFKNGKWKIKELIDGWIS